MTGAALLLLSTSAVGAPSPTRVHFAAVGDFGATTATGTVLEGIAAADPDAAFALGDLSYGATGAEETWCSFVKARTGEGFPFELLSGNHESNGRDGNINDFSACLPNQLPGLVGTYGRQYYVDLPQQDPLVRYIAISPDLEFPDGTWRYDVGTPRYAWTAAAIDGARQRGARWVVVGMHKPCLTTGIYSCDPGPDLTNMLLARKVDLVLSGHEHLYQRTKQLRLGPGCPGLAVSTYDADCVVDDGDDLAAGAGTVFVTLGTGGVSLREHDATAPTTPYFAAVMAGNQDPTYGFGDFDATPDLLTYRFRGTSGAYTDAFTLTRGAAPDNQDPVASFEGTADGLHATFDGAASFDTDGTIASYAWDFGDGTTGEGVAPEHDYAEAGTWSVTLTVTDDDGASASQTRSLVVSPDGPPVLGSDDFERTVASGWGSADVGGAWSVLGRAGEHGVSDGTGRITMSAAGRGPSALLRSVSTTTAEVAFDVTLDKVPTARLDHQVVLRDVAGHRYLGFVRINPNGSVRATLRSKIVGGANTGLSNELTVPGLTYTAGTTLSVRAQAIGTAPTQLRLKVWRAGTPEPAAWTVTAQGTQPQLQAQGFVGLVAYLSSSATNAPLAARYDGFRLVAAS